LEYDRKKCLQKFIDQFVYNKNREKLVDEEPLRTITHGDKKMVFCVMHELFLEEAISEVRDTIELCLQNEIDSLEIIHGHKHGQVLQTYFRSNDFLDDISFHNYRVEIIDISNPGSTIIKILN
jgi:DNA-nicking Smr family endonuclease